MRFICLSVNDDATYRDALAMRNLVRSPWYTQTFNIKWDIRTDQDAKGNYANTEGGNRISMASRSEIVGLGAECVTGDTLVTTEHGPVTIAELHETLERGYAVPRVLSKSLGTGELEWGEIVASRRLPDRRVIRFESSGGHVLTCTPDHRVHCWTEYREAQHSVGQALTTQTGSARVVGWSDWGREDVYDIQVNDNHNFFANGVLASNCILLDDPNNPLKSESRLERDEVNSLWDTNQYNRVNNNVTSLRIGVQQRTHEDDWTGHAIARQGLWSPTNRDGWLQVVIPGEYDPERKFSLPEPLREILRKHLPPEQHVFEDPRTEPGQPIDDVRMPKSWLDSERERWRGTNNYAGQILQRPVSASGGKVQRQWWGWFRLAGGVREHFDEVELGRPRPALCHEGPAQVVHAKTQSPGNWDFDWMTISVDPAAKRTEKGSNYGMLVVAGKGGRRYILDDRTQRGAFHEILEILKEMIIFWQPDSILIEAKAAGPDIMDTLREQMAAGDLPMVTIEEAEPGNSDKEMRLEAALPYIKNGMVYLLDGATWLEDFVEEISMFPASSRDDRVDSLSQILNHVRAEDDCWPSL